MMLKIKGITKEEAPPEVREVFTAQEKQYGSILNTAKVYGLRPAIQNGVQPFKLESWRRGSSAANCDISFA